MFTFFYCNLHESWIKISPRDNSYSTAKNHRSICACMVSHHGKMLHIRDEVSLFTRKGEILVCPIRPP